MAGEGVVIPPLPLGAAFPAGSNSMGVKVHWDREIMLPLSGILCFAEYTSFPYYFQT